MGWGVRGRGIVISIETYYKNKISIFFFEALKNGTLVTNLKYKVRLCDDCLKELLSFTVVNQGVQVTLQIHTKTPCERILFLHPTSTNIAFTSDTFVPGLEEKVKTSLSNCSPIKDIVTLVAQYIQEEMAPYVISVSSKKKKSKSKKVKANSEIIESSNELILDSSKS
ncbi:hypothetical protein ElyMa_004520300 [Elysia marginata]|uniref:Uncharacterized protein n=1 Tax=Elysia marginata TaxID=1093978 RepID=A0AAV4HP70_9GAST|nr:hypothetical protein ElyMa_004520300 [Elysia marginata]